MLTRTLYSFTCFVAITSSLAASQSIPWDKAAYEPDISKGAITFTGHIVNRAGKGDRLPIKRAEPDANDKAPLRMPTNCKPPTDVVGRCFANFRVNQTAA